MLIYLILLVTPTQEANTSMATIAVLVLILGVGSAYALVLVIAPVLGIIKAARNAWHLRSITKFLASEANSLDNMSITVTPKPVTLHHLGAHVTHHVMATTTVGSKPNPSDLTRGR